MILLLWGACALLCAMIGSSKGEGCAAFVMGCVLGPPGLLVCILSPGVYGKCRTCFSRIDRRAQVCPFCRGAL